MRNKPRPALLMKIHWMRKIKNEMRRIKRKESLFSFQILFPLLLLFLFFMWKIEPSSGSQECCAVATDLGRKPSPFPPPTRLTRFLLWTRATTNTTTAAAAAASAGLVEKHRATLAPHLCVSLSLFHLQVHNRGQGHTRQVQQETKKRESRQRNEGKVRFVPGPLHTHPHSFCF